MIFAMIALLVATMLGASLVRTTILSLRQLQREQQQIQAALLADAGCQRAVYRIQSEPDFVGEQWTIPDNQLPARSTGVVQINVAPDPEADSRRIVTVAAEYPRNTPQSTRITRRLTVLRQREDTK